MTKLPSTDFKKIMALDHSTQEMERILVGAVSFGMYLEHIGRYRFAAPFAENLDVLDAACGTGFGSCYLARECGRRVTGLDLSPDAVRYARARYPLPGLSFSLGDVTQMPFLPHCFDLVTSFETIEHVSEPEKFLSECKRVLRRNSMLIMSTPNRTVHEKQEIHVPYHQREFYLEEYRALVGRYFSIQGIFGQWPVGQDQLKPARRMGPSMQRISRYVPKKLRRLAVPFYESFTVKTPLISTICYYRNSLWNDSALRRLWIPDRYSIVPLDRIGLHETFKTFVIVARS